MSDNGKGEYFNSSGCADPTAYEAIGSIIKEDRADSEFRANNLIKVLKSIISLTGFELLARIQIKDKRTGREFR